jgi:hypothetical protein
MADQSITLPPLQDYTAPADQQGGANTEIEINIPLNQPTGKEYAIAGGIVLVAAIIWFIVKNAYANWLIREQKKSPSQGNAAGWSLFGALTFATLGAALGFVDSTRFFSLPYLIPVGLATLACMALALVIAIKR